MASFMVGVFLIAVQDSRTRVSVGVLRNNVKRRFLWRLGRERSWSEEGIGSPRRATTLVFMCFQRRQKKIYCTLLTVRGETVSGGWNPMQALRPSLAGLIFR